MHGIPAGQVGGGALRQIALGRGIADPEQLSRRAGIAGIKAVEAGEQAQQEQQPLKIQQA